MAVEREIRFWVTEGEPPHDGGRQLEQVYLARYPITLRVRLIEGKHAWLTLKLPRHEGSYEWETALPGAWARMLLRLPFLPRIQKRRLCEGDLEVDVFSWPAELVLIECELSPDAGLTLSDELGRARWMEERRPAWVQAWKDVTGDASFSNASLASPRKTRSESSKRCEM
jgi:CYTH domain-containing protein